MTPVIEKNDVPRDHYAASLKNGSLVMEPHCACGNALNDDYFCDQCNRQCHCHHIVCDNETTLKLVERYIRKSPKFSAFKAKLADSS